MARADLQKLSGLESEIEHDLQYFVAIASTKTAKFGTSGYVNLSDVLPMLYNQGGYMYINIYMEDVSGGGNQENCRFTVYAIDSNLNQTTIDSNIKHDNLGDYETETDTNVRIYRRKVGFAMPVGGNEISISVENQAVSGNHVDFWIGIQIEKVTSQDRNI